MEREPKDGLERLPAEKAREKGGFRRSGSRVLDELLAGAPDDMPEYKHDMKSLYSMIAPVGPYSWAASAWFDYLKRTYPSEYSRLETEHLGRGRTLRTGFEHGRRFERTELRSVDRNEYLVFCENLYPEGTDEAEYSAFFHEADVLLYSLGIEVERGSITAEEAWRTLKPYRRSYPPISEPENPTWFPDMDWIMESGMTATDKFKQDAGGLGLTGVDFVSEEERRDSPMPIGSIFEVRSREALTSMRERLSGRYRILVRDQSRYAGLDGLRDAIELLDREVTSNLG